MPRPSQYRQEREGISVYVCPHDQQEFDELYKLKRHLETDHGGFSESEVSAATPAAMAGAEAAIPQPQPRKVSRKSRELNEKLNQCVALITKRIMHGLDEAERNTLASLKGELLVNAMGFDFDFDKGLIPLQSRFWMVVILLATQVESTVPDGLGGKLVAVIKAQREAKKAEEK